MEETSYVLNGQAYGGPAQMLLNANFDTGVYRPFIGKHGRSYIETTVLDRDGIPVINSHTGRPAKQIQQINTDASLRKDEWIQYQASVQDIAYPRMRFYSDLRANVTGVTLADGLGTILLRRQRMGDISGAITSMSPVRRSERDMPVFDYVDTPLPIQIKHFFADVREIRASRRRGEGIDTTMVRKMTRKVAEQVEDQGIGITSSFSYGGGTLYGLTNFVDRNAITGTIPTGAGWTPEDTLNDVLNAIQTSQNDNFDGPYVLYYSRLMTQYMGMDFSAAKGQNTLMQRLEALPDIGMGNVRRLNRLTGYQLILVPFGEDVVEPIIGMEIQVIQYPSNDPFVLEFAVMSMLETQCKSNKTGECGITHVSLA